jgi:DNA-binding NtrC family response regulator
LHSILVVDDEPGIVNAVRRELASPPYGRYRFEVETFTNPLEALERARTVEFEVVISDFRMPEMDGLEFLRQFATQQADCVRMVLSGQTDFTSLIRMINETHIYRFIPKPWSAYFLKSSVAQAVGFRHANVENRRLANILREHDIALPVGTMNPIDQILVVDDDINVANSVALNLTQRNRLNEVFRVAREEGGHPANQLEPSSISVQLSNDPLHALKMASEVTYSCVIADYRMPGIDGAQFLASFNEKQPDCATILLSGDSDIEAVVMALDRAHIHAFLHKPWDDYELRAAVAQVLAQRRLRLENRMLAQLCQSRGIN